MYIYLTLSSSHGCVSVGESMDYHTDFDMANKFADQARAMSTPFHPDNQASLSDLAGISEIKQKRTIARKSVQPIEFAPTQALRYCDMVVVC